MHIRSSLYKEAWQCSPTARRKEACSTKALVFGEKTSRLRSTSSGRMYCTMSSLQNKTREDRRPKTKR